MNSMLFENRLIHINNLFLIALSATAIYFGVERSVFFDGADWIFEIIRYSNNYTPNFRYAVGINGLIPWICSFFTKEIHIIVNAFVINYALTPVVIFIVLRYYFKSEKFVTLFLLGFCFFHSMVFFHPNHDAVTGYYYLILFTAFLCLKNQNIEGNYLKKVFILSFLVVLTHLTQYIFLLIIIFYVYYYINNQFSLSNVLSIAFLNLFIKFFLLSSGYEVGLYSKTIGIASNFLSIFNSTLVISFYKSLATYNIYFSILFLLVLFKLIMEKKYKVIFIFIIAPLLFILYFMSFYFGYWPHTFATEGYFKSAIIIPVYIFITSFIFQRNVNRKFGILTVVIFYFSCIVSLLYIGNNYKKYYNNISFISRQIDKNTIFMDSKLEILEEFYIMHRHSTIINMLENEKCNYFQVINDSFNWVNNSYIQDTVAGGFCFKQKVVFTVPNSDVLMKLKEQKKLIIK